MTHHFYLLFLLASCIWLPLPLRAHEAANEAISIDDSDAVGNHATQVSLADFDAHLAGNPITVGHLKWTYEPFPGAALAQRHVLLSALLLGLGERWELGFVPLFTWMWREHIERNIALKYNFYRSTHLAFSLAYMLDYIEIKYPDYTTAEPTAEPLEDDGSLAVSVAGRAQLYHHGISLLSSMALSAKWSLGASVTSRVYRFYGFSLEGKDRAIPPLDKYLDISYHVLPNLAITAGVTHTHDHLELFYQDDYLFNWGAGASVTWHRPGAFFSKPAVGLHYLEGKREPLYLISTSFY